MKYYVYGITKKGEEIYGAEEDFDKAKALHEKAMLECDGLFQSGYILTKEEHENWPNCVLTPFFEQPNISANPALSDLIKSWIKENPPKSPGRV